MPSAVSMPYVVALGQRTTGIVPTVQSGTGSKTPLSKKEIPLAAYLTPSVYLQ